MKSNCSHVSILSTQTKADHEMKQIMMKIEASKNYKTQSGGGTNDGGYIWVG